MKKRELDNLLDEVTAGIRSEQIDDAAIKGASDRVWSRMNGANTMLADGLQDVGASNRIEGCADFQSLIPAYLGKQLTEARSLLLVDHTHECIPCRKALKNAREARVAANADRSVKMQPRKRAAVPGYNLRPVVLRWGIAAVLVIGLALIALPIVERYVPVGSLDATVQAAEGPLYGVADAKTRALNVGEKIGQGDVLRTSKDGRAMVRLQDGTMIEMKDRSEVSLKRTMNGTTLHVDGGSVIVQATKQQQPRRTVFGKLLRTLHLVPQDWGSFYVQTGDSMVAVAGTTFAVNAGTKGSRVSVIEGEVHLDHNGQDKVLRSGEQATTNVAIEAVPVKEDVKWSRNAAQYSQVLDALASLKNELKAVPKPGVRNSTRLLEMMPATTVMYAAIPNLAASIAESNRIIEERIQQNPALRDWFANRREPRGPAMNQAIAAIKDFGDQLGEEIAVGAGMSDQGQPTEPIVLAQLKNPGGFRAFFDAEVQKLNTNGKAPQVIWIDDPKTAQPAATTGQGPLYVWITGDVLVGSPKLAQLQAVANGASGFSGTPFYSRIAQIYSEGAGIVVAADLEKIIAHTRGVRRIGIGDDHEQALNQLGIFNVTSFVLDSKDTDGKTHTRAVLSYTPADHGITSWLAQPAPMGSLEYISPDANIVAGFAVKNSAAVVDDLLTVMSKVCPDLNAHLDDLQKNHGLNLRSDFAAPLGGEYAFAIDGPVLPTPSWKLVFQVNDPARLQQTFDQVVTEVNKQLAKEGKQGLEWDKADSGGRTFYTLRAKDLGALELNYVIANGYLIACPTRALVEKALQYHDSGSTLIHSPQFTAGLPADGNVNFSAFVYQNIAALAKPLANQAGNLPAGPKNALTMAATMEPTLAYAYAYGDHIEIAANTEGGPFGISPATLLGMPNAFELHSILERGIHGSK
jgi:hypothetical protein